MRSGRRESGGRRSIQRSRPQHRLPAICGTAIGTILRKSRGWVRSCDVKAVGQFKLSTENCPQPRARLSENAVFEESPRHSSPERFHPRKKKPGNSESQGGRGLKLFPGAMRNLRRSTSRRGEPNRSRGVGVSQMAFSGRFRRVPQPCGGNLCSPPKRVKRASHGFPTTPPAPAKTAEG